MNTETVFRYRWNFFKLNKCFKGNVKSTMISARNDYVNEWRHTYYWHPPKWVWTRFRDDFRYLKELIWNQTIYLIWSWCLYNREANTCELRMAYPIYSIGDDWFIDWMWTCTKWCFSSSMFDLEPIDELPRRTWWVVTPGDKYVDVEGRCWRDSDIFIALRWEAAKWNTWRRRWMYWTWKNYCNWSNDWYCYVNGKALQAMRDYGTNRLSVLHNNKWTPLEEVLHSLEQAAQAL